MTGKVQVVSDQVAEPDPPIFSNCLRVGDDVYISGMTAADGAAGVVADTSAYGQARTCFGKIAALLEAAGATMADIVRLRIYVTDMADRADVGRARGEFLSGVMPCSTLVEVGALVHPALRVEIEAHAVVERQ